MTETEGVGPEVPVGLPPPPLGGAREAEWGMTAAQVQDLRARWWMAAAYWVATGVMAPVAILIVFGLRSASTGDAFLLDIGIALAALQALTFLWVCGWSVLRYRLVTRCTVADGRVLLTTLSGRQLDLGPEAIALARAVPRAGLRLYRHPLPAWRVLRVLCPMSVSEQLCEASWRIGVRVELTRW